MRDNRLLNRFSHLPSIEVGPRNVGFYRSQTTITRITDAMVSKIIYPSDTPKEKGSTLTARNHGGGGLGEATNIEM